MTWEDAPPEADDPATGVRPQSDRWSAWVDAWDRALFGPDGFYRRPEGPAGHFRTASHAAPDALAAALVRLAHRHGATAIVDVGAGRGELLRALAATAGSVRLQGVDVVGRPAGLPGPVGWSAGIDAVPDVAWSGALVVAWELLDTVPCPVLEVDPEGEPRVVLVEPGTGRERLGPPATPAHLAWCERWWPCGPTTSAEEGDRVEVGSGRDALWAQLASRALRGGAAVLLAVDYAHTRADRPAVGTLTGYRSGRRVPPRPDGSCDVTAHVALDAVAAGGEASGARTIEVTSQAQALRALGLDGPAELLDPEGLGGFSWLLQVGAAAAL